MFAAALVYGIVGGLLVRWLYALPVDVILRANWAIGVSGFVTASIAPLLFSLMLSGVPERWRRTVPSLGCLHTMATRLAVIEMRTHHALRLPLLYACSMLSCVTLLVVAPQTVGGWWTLATMAVLSALVGWAAIRSRVGVPMRTKQCAVCRYPWSPPLGAVCPECGVTWRRPKGLRRQSRAPRKLAAALAIAAALVPAVVCVVLSRRMLAIDAVPTQRLLARVQHDPATVGWSLSSAVSGRNLSPAQEQGLAESLIAAREAGIDVPSAAWESASAAFTAGRLPPGLIERYVRAVLPLRLQPVRTAKGPAVHLAGWHHDGFSNDGPFTFIACIDVLDDSTIRTPRMYGWNFAFYLAKPFGEASPSDANRMQMSFPASSVFEIVPVVPPESGQTITVRATVYVALGNVPDAQVRRYSAEYPTLEPGMLGLVRKDLTVTFDPFSASLPVWTPANP